MKDEIKIGYYVGNSEFPRFKVTSFNDKYVYGITDDGELVSMITRMSKCFKILN